MALFGADEPRKFGKELWKAARNGVNDFLGKLDAPGRDSGEALDCRADMDKIPSGMGHAGERFLDACHNNLQENFGVTGSHFPRSRSE